MQEGNFNVSPKGSLVKNLISSNGLSSQSYNLLLLCYSVELSSVKGPFFVI